MPTLEKVVIQVKGDVKLDPTIQKLQKLGKIDKDNAKQFKKSSKEFQDSTNKSGSLIDGLGRKALVLGTALIGAFAIKQVIGSAINILKDFEKAMSELSAITGATGKDLKFLEEQAKRIGRTSTISAAEAVIAFKLMASAKPELLSAKEQLAEVTDEAVKLAEASGLDLPTAIEALAITLNSMELAADQASRVVNVLAAASLKGAKEIPFLTFALSKFGGVAASAGLSVEQSAAAIELLGEKIPQAETVGTNLRNIIIQLQIEAQKQGRTFRDLGDELDSLTPKLDDVTFLTKTFGKENILAIQTLIKQKDRLGDLTEAITGTNAAQEQQIVNTDNLDSALKKLDNAFDIFILGLGGSAGVLRSTVDFMTGLLLGISDLIEGTDVLTREFFELDKEIKSLEKDLTPLLTRYDELTEKTILNKNEQEELDRLILKLAEDVPLAVTEFDKFGKALGISTEAAREFIEEQKAILRIKNKEAIEEQTEAITDLGGELVSFSLQLRKVNDEFVEQNDIILKSGTIVKNLRKLTADEVIERAARRQEIESEIKARTAIIAQLKGEETEAEKLLKTTKDGTKTIEDSISATKRQIRNVFFLTKEVAELKKELKGEATSLSRIAEIQRELVPLEKELTQLIKKRTDSIKELLDLQEKSAGRISDEEAAEEAHNAFLEGLLDEQEERSLREIALDKAASEAVKANREQREREDKEAADKRIETINMVANAAANVASKLAEIRSGLLERQLQEEEEAFNVRFEKEAEEFERQKEMLQTQFDDNIIREDEFNEKRLILEEQFNESKTQLEDDFDKKRVEFKTKQAKADKLAAIFSAIINTAAAVVSALVSIPPNIPLSIVVGVTGAAQTAAIAAQPIPVFHKGKKAELSDEEFPALIKKSEYVIPPEQSRKHSEDLDAMLHNKFDKFVFMKYQMPIIKQFSKQVDQVPYDDFDHKRNQRKQINLLSENNRLLRQVIITSKRQSYGWE